MAETKAGSSPSRTWFAEIVVTPKLGVSDPAGTAVRGGLQNLGYDDVQDVRVGRFIRVEIEAESEGVAYGRAVQMCDELLANPVIEEYQITVHGSGRGTSARNHGGERK